MSNIWYTAHCGSYSNPEKMKRVPGTFSRKEIFERAQQLADETGEIVTVTSKRGTVNGLIHNTYKVNPN